jgi:hypothetical protein
MNADARQADFCTYLSAILLGGLILNVAERRFLPTCPVRRYGQGILRDARLYRSRGESQVSAHANKAPAVEPRKFQSRVHMEGSSFSCYADRFRRVLLLLDGDEAGRRARDRVVARLRNRCEERVMDLPEGAQPDQLPDCQLRELIESATGGASRVLRG